MANQRQSSKQIKKRKKSKRREVIIISIVVVVLIAFVFIYTSSLKETLADNNERIEKLEAQIEEESERSDDLDEEEDFMTSNEFIEKIARERLGLVNPGETIVKSEN